MGHLPTVPSSPFLDAQHGVIARGQIAAAGLSVQTLRSRLRTGAWQQLQRGVYATFTGEPPRIAVLWAAVLRAGPRAILSHESAAELDGLMSGPAVPIHVTVPAGHRVRNVTDAAVHQSDRIEQARHPGLLPPRTMIEETVLDLTQTATSLDDAIALVSRACADGLTTPFLLRWRMGMRARFRWRAALTHALSDVQEGAHSLLEYRHLNRVERAHGLPRAQRQVRVARGRRRQYRDAVYEEFGVCVELDGREAHPADARWRDIRRDNASAADGIITLRYGWADVTNRPCEVAAEIAAVLRGRGWTGQPRACEPGCPLSARYAAPGPSASRDRLSSSS
jgi:very-short-patch-repair endonuclease